MSLLNTISKHKTYIEYVFARSNVQDIYLEGQYDRLSL